MTISNENTKTIEQIKNQKSVSDTFYQQLKVILEKDEFNVFKTKSKISLDKQIKISNTKIQRLLDLKTKSEKTLEQLINKRKSLFLQNKKLKENLIKKLNLEVL